MVHHPKGRWILVNIAEWQMLFESVPCAWRNTIALGNQQFNNHDFFATSLVNGDIGYVYEYIDGQLHYYDHDEQFNLIDTHQRGIPGSFLPNEPVSFPELDQLKRV